MLLPPRRSPLFASLYLYDFALVCCLCLIRFGFSAPDFGSRALAQLSCTWLIISLFVTLPRKHSRVADQSQRLQNFCSRLEIIHADTIDKRKKYMFIYNVARDTFSLLFCFWPIIELACARKFRERLSTCAFLCWRQVIEPIHTHFSSFFLTLFERLRVHSKTSEKYFSFSRCYASWWLGWPGGETRDGSIADKFLCEQQTTPGHPKPSRLFIARKLAQHDNAFIYYDDA